jgi:hypothetical protein
MKACAESATHRGDVLFSVDLIELFARLPMKLASICVLPWCIEQVLGFDAIQRFPYAKD